MPRAPRKIVVPPGGVRDKEPVAPSSILPEQTLQAMLDAFQPYISGMIQSLGIASQPREREDGTMEAGDLDAAKKALDFLSRAMAGNKAEGRGADVLKRIKELREQSDTA